MILTRVNSVLFSHVLVFNANVKRNVKKKIKEQVTIHPYVVYYRKDNETNNHNFLIVSGYDTHDAIAVNIGNISFDTSTGKAYQKEQNDSAFRLKKAITIKNTR